MTREVVWSSAAQDDYLEIVRYVAERNPDAAFRLAKRLDQVVATLAEMPTGRPGRVTGTFEKVMPGSPYIVAYEVTEGAKGEDRVTILHVIHSARDWPDEAWPQG